ncbi:MAG TPA: beta-propeller domain-containing protein, partial [Thermoguttaceae bacterium]|nr:beta-propeller domain-containing protein [Thermoguttaceae bacterium]
MLRNLLNSTRRSRSIGQFAKNRRAHCSERGLRFESLESRTLLDGGGLSGMVYWEADADYIYERGEQPLASFEIELRRHENHLRTQTYLDIGRGQPFDIRGDQYLVGIREPDHPANRTNAAYLYDLESGQILQTFYRPDQGNGSEEAKYRQGDFGRSVLFAGDNVLVDSLEGVYLFDATTGNLLQTFPDLEPVSNHKILRHPLAATADRLLLADPEDNAVELYDLATGELLRTFEHPHPELMATFGRDVAFSGDNILISTGRGHGRYIVDGVDIYADAPEYVPGSVLTYDADTGELLHTFEDPAANEGFSFGAGLDTYGNRVLIGDALDSAAYLFDTTTYDLVQTFRHPDPDGSLGSSVEITSEAVYVSGSGTEGSAAVHVFDIDTGELRKSFEHPRFHETQTPTHADLLFGSQLAADGEYFLAGSSDIIPSIELFTLSPGAPAEGDVRTMTTGQHGSYGFGDLEPGFYTVSVTKIVEGYTLTPPETVGKSTPYSQLPPLPCSDGVYHVAISGETNSYLHGWSHLNFSYTGPEPTPQPTFTPEWPLMPEPGSDRTSEQTFDLLSEDATAASDFAQFGSDEELRQFLLDDALERYDSQFGQPVYSLPPFGPVLVWPHSPQRTISTYDGPNTRVNTVEDGDYLYALVGGELVIFDGLLTEQPQVVSRVTVSGDPLAHFVDGDRLAVVSRVGPEVLVDNDNSHHYTISGRPEQLVTVFDISDREAPRVVQEIAIEGGYVGSRLVDDSLHIVLNDIFYLPSPKLIPTSTTGYNNVSYYET